MNRTFFFLSLASFFAACHPGDETPKTTQPPYTLEASTQTITLGASLEKANPMRSEPIRTETLSEEGYITGSLETLPSGTSVVQSPVSGIIRDIRVQPGQAVGQGQVVATLQSAELSDYHQQGLTLENDLKYARLELARQQKLNATGSGADKVLEQARQQVSNLELRLRALQQRRAVLGLDSGAGGGLVLRARGSGIVQDLNLRAGQYIQPQDVLARIVGRNGLVLELRAMPHDLEYLQPGQTVEAVSLHGGKSFPAVIQTIGQQASASHTVPVRARFLGSAPELPLGSALQVRVKHSSSQAASLPEEAVLSYEGKTWVFEDLGHRKYRMLPLQAGRTAQGRTEVVVTDPRYFQKRFVTQGAYNLLMALKNVSDE